MNKKFLQSLTAAILGLSLATSCSLVKKEEHKCGAAKKEEGNKCSDKKAEKKAEKAEKKAKKSEVK